MEHIRYKKETEVVTFQGKEITLENLSPVFTPEQEAAKRRGTRRFRLLPNAASAADLSERRTLFLSAAPVPAHSEFHSNLFSLCPQAEQGTAETRRSR